MNTRKCAVRTGFFVLRDCAEDAPQACAACARPVCQEHARPGAAGPLCLDCHGKERHSLDDDDGVFGYRRSFYGGIGYAPLYLGGDRPDPVYDEFDVRAFSRRRGATAGYGATDTDVDYDYEDGPASFADS